MASKILNLYRDPETKAIAFTATGVTVLAIGVGAYWWFNREADPSTQILKPIEVKPEPRVVSNKRGRFAHTLDPVHQRLEKFKKNQQEKYSALQTLLRGSVGAEYLSVEVLVKIHEAVSLITEKDFSKLVEEGRKLRRTFVQNDKAIYEEVVIENYREIQELFEENLKELLREFSVTFDHYKKSFWHQKSSADGNQLLAFEGRELYLALLRKIPALGDLPDDESEELTIKLLNHLSLQHAELLYKPADQTYRDLVKEKLAFESLFETYELEEEDVYKLIRKFNTPQVTQLAAEFKQGFKYI